MTDLPEGLLKLLEAPSICLISTINPDGSPHLTEVWVGTDGTHVLINTVSGFRKLRNVQRDPRVAVSVLDRENPTQYWSIAGTVIEAGEEHGPGAINELSLKYTGGPYQNYGGPDAVRVLLTIRIDKIVREPMRR